MKKDLIDFYKHAKKVCIAEGFKEEIDMVESRTFDKMTREDFFREYVYVVCNSGMKNQVAEKIYHSFLKEGISAINHLGKRSAILSLMVNDARWFDILKKISDTIEQIDYLETLPFIGKITKYHLARNLGIDCAKPDRHLVRIANHFKYDDVQTMCSYISLNIGDRPGSVDVVLWRVSTIMPPWDQKEGEVPGW